jgi:hypothetical protein
MRPPKDDEEKTRQHARDKTRHVNMQNAKGKYAKTQTKTKATTINTRKTPTTTNDNDVPLKVPFHG